MADDSRLHRQIIVDALADAGHEVLVAVDGVEAARLALTEPPDLIVLDVEMPGMTGYQVAHLLNDDPVAAAVPLIFLTGKDHPGDRYWGLRLGAAYYLSKTATREEILAAVEEALADAPVRTDDLVTARCDADGLLERLAGILDRRLFESVVAAELAGLVDRSEEYRRSLSATLETMRHIADFDAAVLLLPEDQQLVACVTRKIDRTVLTICEARAWEAMEGTCQAMPAELQQIRGGSRARDRRRRPEERLRAI